jgi:hypothetical protein
MAMAQKTAQFSITYYFQVLTKVLGAPGTFFRELPENNGFIQSIGFLVVSAAFSSGAAVLTQPLEQPLVAGGIYFINAMGMTLIAAGLGYIIMVMTAGRKVGFQRFFCVYAFASGVTLLAAWIPLFVWLTEPWKWILIGVGLSKTIGLKWIPIVLIIGISIAVIILFFWSLAAMVLPGH